MLQNEAAPKRCYFVTFALKKKNSKKVFSVASWSYDTKLVL